MSLLAPEVLAGWPAFTESLEGRKKFPYLDTHEPKPIVTSGLGCAFLDLADFAAQPWKVDGAPAGPDEVSASWVVLENTPGGLLADHYEPLTRLRLTDPAIDALSISRLVAAAVILAKRWPHLPSYPWQAQMGVSSLGCAVGPGDEGEGLTGAAWPNLHEAIDARDWRRAASECALRGNPKRSAATSALFLAAAAGGRA